MKKSLAFIEVKRLLMGAKFAYKAFEKIARESAIPSPLTKT